ncbi:MAG: MFS transporter [Chromatiales bacterium]|nr:MAG: MFS transporter [Chromatiales bacterium]
MELRQTIDQGPVSGLQIRVILLCCVINMLDGLDVLAISFAAPPIATEWQLQPAALGIVFSTGLVGMALGSMFIAPLTDRIGRRAMILISLFVIGLAMIATGLVRTVNELLVARAVTGLGIGAILASLTSMVAEYTPDRHRNLTVSILQAGYPVGGTIGGFVAAWLIPEYGWRAIFFVGAALGLAMVPLVYLLLPESLQFLEQKRPVDALTRINRVLVRMGRAPLAALGPLASRAEPSRVATLLTPERRSNTLKLWFAFMLNSLAVYFILSWVPKIVVDAGLPLEQGIFAGIMVNAGAVLGIVVLGYASGKRGLRPLIFGFLLAGAVALVVFGFLPALVPALLVVGFLIGFFVIGGYIGLYSVAARIYPTEVRTTGIGWTIGVGRFGSIVGPYLGGILIALDWSTGPRFITFAVPLLVAAVVAVSISARELVPKRD